MFFALSSRDSHRGDNGGDTNAFKLTFNINKPALNLPVMQPIKGLGQEQAGSTGFGLNIPINKLQIPSQEANSYDHKQPLQKSQNYDFYIKNRKKRKLYCDKDLHSSCIQLMFALLINKNTGVFEDVFCSKYPVNDGKQNYLHILHHHLDCQENSEIVSILQKTLININPYPSGIRLLKLLCSQLSHLNCYQEERKIDDGQYGTISLYNTGFQYPKQVAIKSIPFNNYIHDRCELYDIISEVSCMDIFRMNDHLVRLYDYGLTQNDYFIVMKKYTTSLRKWRVAQDAPLSQMLMIYLDIFWKVMVCIQSMHSNLTTHYDLKCDNLLISFKEDDDGLNPDTIEISLADFGECK